MIWQVASSMAAHITSWMRCPAVVVSAHVHSFLVGYLSGQLGLVMVPEMEVTLWSQPAARRGSQGSALSKVGGPSLSSPDQTQGPALLLCPGTSHQPGARSVEPCKAT